MNADQKAQAQALSLLEEEQGEFCFMDCGTEEDQLFDEIVGCLSDILIGEEFECLQQQFYARYCHEFDNSDENKLIYTTIYQEWVQTIESTLENSLQRTIPNFSMHDFIQMVATRQDQITHEVFELLCTFGDFDTFKQNMLEFKVATAENFSCMTFGLDVHAAPLSRDH